MTKMRRRERTASLAIKKLAALTLALILSLSLAACGETPEDARSGADPASWLDAPGSASKAGGGKTTLMIYMIGSDLEVKSGAGTEDMGEIEKSGADLSACDIMLYAGGSPHWHNDSADKSENRVLRLTKNGFRFEKSFKQTSMGEAETLTGFMDYCANNCPAEHYALILWDHGNGPLMGYGKDMLFKNDALTLEEMKTALEASRFSENNKLDWVGFDACLMASAELACIWAPYARYLVASQEVEPSFGWNYGFLKKLGKTDTEALIGDIADRYLDSCLKYFKKKDYHDRDTTLACLDLSGADELKGSVNALFAEASKNIGKHYDSLAALRVGTRALGRASTGSEYDLVDLLDLSNQLSKDYPKEAKRLKKAIESMVVKNSTNAERLSGISIYYPFYNKSYYKKEWSKTYQGMNLFGDYNKYLAQYEKIWLGEDMLKDYAKSSAPEREAADRYSLRLTDEQKKHFVSARYYILKREGKETFTRIFSSSDVALSGNILSAGFDGNVIYAHNSFDQYFIPVMEEHDSVGGITNYSAAVQLNNSNGDPLDNSNISRLNCRCLIAANKAEKSIGMSALTEWDGDQSAGALAGGKENEVDVSGYTTYVFYSERHRTLVRGEGGLVMPVREWKANDSYTANTMNIADGLEFVYAPLGYGRYSMIFEITDAQGSEYCSEPVDIDTSNINWLSLGEKEKNEVESDLTFPLLLKEDESLALYLDKVSGYEGEELTLSVRNKSKRKLSVMGDELVCNGNISCDDGSLGFFEVEPGKTESYKYGISFGAAKDTGALKALSELSFTVDINDFNTKKTIWSEEGFRIKFKKGKEYKFPADSVFDSDLIAAELDDPFGAKIEKQTVADDGRLRLELLNMGMEREYFKGVYRFENKTDGTLFLASDGTEIDGIFCGDTRLADIELPAGMTAYRKFSVRKEKLEKVGIKGFSSLRLSLRFGEGSMTLWQGYGSVEWLDLALSRKSAAKSALPKAERALMKEKDVTVSYLGYEEDDSGDYRRWNISVENGRSEGISLMLTDIRVNGKAYSDDSSDIPIYIDSGAKAGGGGGCVTKISSASLLSDVKPKDIRDMEFRFIVCDFTGERILFKSSETVKLR